jgi:hypothetical protein
LTTAFFILFLPLWGLGRAQSSFGTKDTTKGKE